jgi:adenylate cyclase
MSEPPLEKAPGARRWIVPLQLNILTVFIVILATIVGVVVFHTHSRNRDAALAAAAALMDEVGEKILERLKWLYDPAYALVGVSTELAGANVKPNLATHPLESAIVQILDLRPSITSAFLGFADGDFYRVVRVEQPATMLNAPPDTGYAIQRIQRRADGDRFALWKYLDQARRPVGSHLVRGPGYDPREWPWYQAAIRVAEPTLSDLYVFADASTLGVTVARRLDGPIPGVFGVDIALSDVAGFLAAQRFSRSARLFMFHGDGRLTAHPDPGRAARFITEGGRRTVALNTIEALEDPVASALFRSFRATEGGFERRIINVAGEAYVARVDALPSRYGRDAYIAMAVPVDEFVAPVVAAGRDAVLFAAAVFVFFLPIVVWIAARISRPLRRLTHEAEEIRALRLEEPIALASRIKEIVALGGAMAAMKSTLAGFTKYVPKALVGRMIESGITPQLGGARRHVTLMFTDVADFTVLSDTMDPEALAHKISAYFEALGTEILKSGGTIDKYIGDGIMAFWNAPQIDPYHQRNACLAALRCRERSAELNARWTKAGEAPMPTRFGLHAGEAVVGNIGSSDRMDYTAMGGAVNLASRLEGLNKFFGTEILVSETVRKATMDWFVFRTVGRVIPKGRRTSTEVFELVGTDPAWEGGSEELAVTSAEVAYCRDWNDAFALYLDRDWAGATESFTELADRRSYDLVARFYLARAKSFLENPPGPDWDGVEVFETK